MGAEGRRRARGDGARREGGEPRDGESGATRRAARGARARGGRAARPARPDGSYPYFGSAAALEAAAGYPPGGTLNPDAYPRGWWPEMTVTGELF